MADQYAAAVLGTPGLEGYWRLNQASGNATDMSGNGRDLTPAGGLSYQQGSGLFGPLSLANSVLFHDQAVEANAEYFTGGDIAALELQEGSLECWFKLQNLIFGGNSRQLCGKAGDANRGVRLDVGDVGEGDYALHINVEDSAFARIPGIKAGLWFHVVGTWTSGGALALYLNGNPGAIGTYSTPVGYGNEEFSIGVRRNNGSSSHIHRQDCFIQEVAIYSSVLSPGTVLGHYRAGVTHLTRPSMSMVS